MGARSPEEEELSNEYEPDTAEGPDDNGSVNNEDDECVLDESSDEDLNQKKRKGKKKSDNRQLRMQVQSAQGKSTSEDGKNLKRKANKNQEEL
jgi:phosphatidate phosphatase PAH1